jgi:hypothetical protein
MFNKEPSPVTVQQRAGQRRSAPGVDRHAGHRGSGARLATRQLSAATPGLLIIRQKGRPHLGTRVALPSRAARGRKMNDLRGLLAARGTQSDTLVLRASARPVRSGPRHDRRSHAAGRARPRGECRSGAPAGACPARSPRGRNRGPNPKGRGGSGPRAALCARCVAPPCASRAPGARPRLASARASNSGAQAPGAAARCRSRLHAR